VLSRAGAAQLNRILAAERDDRKLQSVYSELMIVSIKKGWDIFFY
jgi:hypothetical protein